MIGQYAAPPAVDFSKHIQKAEEALRRRNFDYAVELFRQLVDLDPDLGEARAGLRQALRKRQETKKGGKFLRAVSGALPLSRAKACLKMGKNDAGAKALEDYLATNPLDEEANLMLGQALEAGEHFRSARAVYEFTAEIAPKNASALKSAGAMMQKTGDPERALEYFERALAVDPRDQEALKARKNLAAHMALERSSSDKVSHSREMMKGKEEAAGRERGRRMHLSEEELDAELARLETAFADDPSNPDRMIEISGIHQKRKDFEAALEFAQRALEYRRDSSEIACLVGDLESRVWKRRIAKADKEGRAEEASRLEAELLEREVEDWTRRVRLHPGEAETRLTLAKKLIRAGRTDDALGELQRCQSEPRVRADALFLLGQCFEEQGILELARKEYEHALEGRVGIDERAKEILYHLGCIAENEGNHGEARSRFLQIYEVDIKYRDIATKMRSLQ